MRKILALIFIIIIIFLGSLSAYLYITNLRFKRTLSGLDKQKEGEFNKRIVKEREFIRRGLAEKYQADRVSYEAMAKRMEIERKRVRELEEKLKNATHP